MQAQSATNANADTDTAANRDTYTKCRCRYYCSHSCSKQRPLQRLEPSTWPATVNYFNMHEILQAADTFGRYNCTTCRYFWIRLPFNALNGASKWPIIMGAACSACCRLVSSNSSSNSNCSSNCDSNTDSNCDCNFSCPVPTLQFIFALNCNLASDGDGTGAGAEFSYHLYRYYDD